MRQHTRTIKPEFWHDEVVASLKPFTRLLMIGLLGLADRKGLLEDIPILIRSLVFPFEPKLDVDSMLNELNESRLVLRYKHENRAYLWVRNFEKHQSVHPNEAKSVIPIPRNYMERNDISLRPKSIYKSKSKSKRDPIPTIPFDEIISDLNHKANTRYRPTTPKTMELIRVLWQQGFGLNDFHIVHTKKCNTWLNTEYAKYLRPITLYSNKFEGYLNEEVRTGSDQKKLSWADRERLKAQAGATPKEGSQASEVI